MKDQQDVMPGVAAATEDASRKTRRSGRSRFEMWIATFIIISAFAFYLLMPFVGALGGDVQVMREAEKAVSYVLLLVIGYVYGSSSGSAKKQEAMDGMMKRVVGRDGA